MINLANALEENGGNIKEAEGLRADAQVMQDTFGLAKEVAAVAPTETDSQNPNALSHSRSHESSSPEITVNIRSKLIELNLLLDEGLITKGEYDASRKSLLGIL